MRLIPFLLVLAVAAAGCITPANLDAASDGAAPVTRDAFVPAVPEFDFSTVVDPDHGAHQVPDLHTIGHGLDLLGHASVADVVPEGVQGSITSIDVKDGWAVVPGMQGELGFVLVDIHDPANPKAVSAFPGVGDGWTARFSADGNFVFHGCQVLGALSPYGHVKGSCEDVDELHAGTAEAMVVAVDVTDKANPTFVTALPAAGTHNIQATSINGEDIIVTAATEIIRFDRESGTLELLATVPGVHDATVAVHPVTGDHLLYTGAGGGSFAVYDVNDPANPVPVYEGGLEGVVGWHEQTAFPTLVGGRALLALGGETFVSPEGVPDTVFIVDVTDPADPVKLGEWKPPFDPKVPWVSYTFSVHEMAATPTGQLAVSWYHAGAWVLDVSTPERQASPVTLAAFQPSEPINVMPSTFAQTPVPLTPFVWGVGWDARGYLVVPDMHTGVYVLEPEWGLVPGLDGGN